MGDESEEIVLNVCYTDYDVVREVGEDLDWYIYDEDDEEEDEEEWDVLWTDFPLSNKIISKLNPSQRVSNFPGVQAIARKNNLCKNLNAIRNLFPVEYAFFPATWCLPQEINIFKQQFAKKSAKTFIVKPEASAQGKGIFLTRSLKKI